MPGAYETLATITNFNDKVDFLATIDFNDDCQPWCFTQHLGDVKDQADPIQAAYEVAQAFKARSGLIIIEAEASYCTNQFRTIMDEFEFSRPDDKVRNSLLKRAFQKAGFKYAHQCETYELIKRYAQAGYSEYRIPQYGW